MQTEKPRSPTKIDPLETFAGLYINYEFFDRVGRRFGIKEKPEKDIYKKNLKLFLEKTPQQKIESFIDKTVDGIIGFVDIIEEKNLSKHVKEMKTNEIRQLVKRIIIENRLPTIEEEATRPVSAQRVLGVSKVKTTE